MKFSDNLKTWRTFKKISQEKLAEKGGGSRQSVSKWENGDAYPEMTNILVLCKIFNCKITDLIQESMVDIDKIDEPTKKEVIKFKIEKQEKVMLISNIMIGISLFMKVIAIIVMISVSITFVMLPPILIKLSVTNSELKFLDYKLTYEYTDKGIAFANYQIIDGNTIFETF